MLSIKFFLVLISCQLCFGVDQKQFLFDGNLNQQVLSTWENITNNKYINVANRNLTSVDSQTFNGLIQLEQLYVYIF